MIYKSTKKNKFGGDTWHVKLDSLFHIFISSTNKNSFLVEIKEFRWISYKTRKSYISDKDLEPTVMESFDEIQNYLNGTGKYHWSDIQKENKLSEVIPIIRDYQKSQIKVGRTKKDESFEKKYAVERTKVAAALDVEPDLPKTTYASNRINTADAFNVEADFPETGTKKPQLDDSKVIQIIRGVSIDKNIVNLTTSQMIVEKYGEPDATVNHNNFSYELNYKNLGLSFFYKQNDPVQLIYLMMATGQKRCETDTGLIFDRSLTMEKVISDYGMGDVRATDDSDEAKMVFPGIMFYAKKIELINLEADEISVQKIAILEF